MARTSSGAVQGLLKAGGDYDTIRNPSLEGFILAASTLVDDLVECLTAKGLSYSETKLEVIERWLAAHFYQQSDQGYAERSSEKGKGVFHGKTGMGLDSTKYGQSAKLLDRSGCLRAMDTPGARASITWLGKPPSDQIPYEQRD